VINATTIDILLVEDSLPDVRLTEEALRDTRVPHRLHVVYDGVQAMDFLRRREPWTDAPTPDLILLDLNLPRKDGREVLHDIGLDDELSQIPVVVLTTSEAEQDITQSYRLGANAFVTKPVDLDRFLEAVRSIENFWLETARLTRPSKATS
jgi:CheY-like chemotaxis protein